MLTQQKQWYAVYTRPRFEKKVSKVCTARDIENFCPLNRVVRQWADRKKTVQEPLFSCYLFVHIAPSEHTAVRQIEGVYNFVHWMGKPAVIRPEEIETVKRFLDDHINVKLEKIQVNRNDRVRIVSGPLMAEEGSVVEVMRHAVKVCLPSLGYAMLAEVRMTNVEIVHVHPNSSNTKDRSNAVIR